MRHVHIDDLDWPSTEHYFQAQKFIGTRYVEDIWHLATPRKAFEMSRRPKVAAWKRCDWECIKQSVMLKALLSKFMQHDNLKEMLIGTGMKELIETLPMIVIGE